MNKKHKEDLEQQLAKFHEVGSSNDVLMSLLKKGHYSKVKYSSDKLS